MEDKKASASIDKKEKETTNTDEPINTFDDEEESNVIDDEKPSHNKFTTIIITVMTVIIAVMALFIWKNTLSSQDEYIYESSSVMTEQKSPDLKAKQLDPTKVYRLKSSSDSYNGLSVAVTKVQFRQDMTRLWLKIDNDSGRNISMIPSANARLTDDKGRTYKTDYFGGDQVSSISPGTHEEILLAFEPIRADAKTITFSLDSVFDMKHSAWNYTVQFDVP